MTDAKLKSYVDRIENLEEERKAINGNVRDIYTEAKGNGYNPKALRKIVALRKQKDDAQLDADIETYKAALGMHGSYRKAAKALGITKSKLHRSVPREENGTATPPHDSETGEISDGAGANDPGRVPQAERAEAVPGYTPEIGSGGGEPPACKAPEGQEPSTPEELEEARTHAGCPQDPWEAADESFARLQAMKRERGIGVAPDALSPDSPKRLNVTETV